MTTTSLCSLILPPPKLNAFRGEATEGAAVSTVVSWMAPSREVS